VSAEVKKALPVRRAAILCQPGRAALALLGIPSATPRTPAWLQRATAHGGERVR
jgi:hypothetical protein